MTDVAAGNRRARRSAASRSQKKPAVTGGFDSEKSVESKPRLKVLHLHSTFDRGGKEARAIKLMNHWGDAIDHSIVSAVPGATGAIAEISATVPHRILQDFPPLAGGFSMGRYLRLARAMAGCDLVLTYNWGAMDAVMAHTLHGRRMGLPPLVHHEDGFNEDEANGLKWSRNVFRQLALSRAAGLVVPSRRLEAIALQQWRRPRASVTRIPNGVDTAAYQRKPQADAIPGVIKRADEFWVGTLAGLRAVKNLPRLVRSFAPLPENWQLVILGEGPQRDAIRAEASRLGIDHRLLMPGHVANPASYIGLFDLFALSSDSEQFPISVVEAMAAGLPVASPAVGDVRDIVASPNHRFITPSGDEAALSAALAALADDAALRASIGEANRAKALASYDEAQMFRSYAAIYASAMGRTRFV